PLLIVAPGSVPAGKVVTEPVSVRDLPATVVDLLQLKGEHSFPGRSLARFWTPPSAGEQPLADLVFAELVDERPFLDEKERRHQSIAVRDHVYIRKDNGVEELYNIASDPAQAENLANKAGARAILNELRSSHQRFLAENPDVELSSGSFRARLA